MITTIVVVNSTTTATPTAIAITATVLRRGEQQRSAKDALPHVSRGRLAHAHDKLFQQLGLDGRVHAGA